MKHIRKIIFSWLIHCAVVWFVTMLFTVIPYMYRVRRNGNYHYNEDGSPFTAWQYFMDHLFRYDALVVALLLLLAELSYQLLFPKINLWRFALSSIGASLIAFIFLALGHPRTIETYGLLSGVEPTLYMSAYVFVYALIRDQFYQHSHKKDVKLQRSENELNALKAQLNPHFLFNSLNYLYGTALNEGATRTADGIDKLSDLLRYTVTGIDQNYVPLNEEITFIENYLDLQKARLPQNGNIKLDIQINAGNASLQIAPLLLLTFIENAFKYGISADEDCHIQLHIDVSDKELTMQITNKIITTSHLFKTSNTGLTTTQKRLELLYPHDHELQINNNGATYHVTLKLNLTPTQP